MVAQADKLSYEAIRQIEAAATAGNERAYRLLQAYRDSLTPLELFEPRPDSPEDFDQQTAFVESTAPFSICLGGTGCLAGEERIYDPVARAYRRVDQIRGPFHVLALDEASGRTVDAVACQPHCKGVADLYRVTLSDGQQFTATIDHRVHVGGTYLPLRRLERQQRLPRAPHPTNWGSAPLAFRPSAGHSTRTLPNSPADCRPACRFCGERLRRAIIGAPAFAPRQADAPARSPLWLPGDAPACGPGYSHACPRSARPAMTGFYRQGTSPPDASESRVSCIPYGPASDSGRAVALSQPQTAHRLRTTAAYPRRANQSGSTWPCDNSLGDTDAETVYITKLEFIRTDQFWDFTVPIYHNYALAGVFHHNSGKTAAAAYKTARYLLNNPPPRERCGFWVIGDTLDQVCAICWDEKLSNLIPEHLIAHTVWYKRKLNYPTDVLLRHPTKPGKIGWVIQFKSYQQGLAGMKGRSIGGYWFNEEVPLEIVEEVQWRTRDYVVPGWADFTPLEIVSPEWPEMYSKPPAGWEFFHLNTRKNHYINQEFAGRMLDAIPEDERATRETGHFSTFKGAVFKEFLSAVHVLDPDDEELAARDPNLYEIAGMLDIHKLPVDWHACRGIDFGWSAPTVCIWAARDPDGRYFIYDEHYRSQLQIEQHAEHIKQRPWLYGHPAYGPTYCDSEDPAGINRLNALTQSPDKNPYFRPVEKLPHDLGVQISLLRQLMLVQGDGRPKFYVLSKCKNLIREIRGYRWHKEPKNPDAATPVDMPVQRDDHAVDAMRYAVCHDARGPRAPAQSIRRAWVPREGIRLARGRE